jgi:helix-turn-helix, Psq domain
MDWLSFNVSAAGCALLCTSCSDPTTIVMPHNKGVKTDPRLALLPPCDPNLSVEGRLAFVKQLHRSQHDKPSNEQISIAKLASHYEVTKSTLQDRINGVLPKSESNAAKSLSHRQSQINLLKLSVQLLSKVSHSQNDASKSLQIIFCWPSTSGCLYQTMLWKQHSHYHHPLLRMLSMHHVLGSIGLIAG